MHLFKLNDIVLSFKLSILFNRYLQVLGLKWLLTEY